jgi:glycosyltransferase involved in cell wall biosynthesis
MKLACVIHRFGPDIAGGSEAHCRAVADQLAARHDVTILTTCAKDHITWRNEIPVGESRLGALRVRRFPVARPRSLHRFAEISEVVFGGWASDEQQEEWVRENGPDVPELLAFLEHHGSDYDRILFWSFRYYDSFFGLPLVADRAVLLPTAEDDPAIRLGIVGRFFAKVKAFVFLTPEERLLVEARTDGPLPSWCVIGSGLEPASADGGAPVATLGVRKPFLLYLGRVDPNKGCGTLIRHFVKWEAQARPAVPLVLAGPVNMPIPDHPSIKPLGYVGEAARETLLTHADLLIVPSPFESLSIVLLEAWNHAVPALVNGHCSVLRGQALRGDGGLYYRNFDEFAQALDLLLRERGVARRLGQQGLAYVDREYRWPHVVGKLEAFLASTEPAAYAGHTKSANTEFTVDHGGHGS